ncbi:MAG TPA: acyl-CoA dehydrogenase C-terminal domain-containing protein [Acetobacteraceae bacterium]|jgi:acyl-CoA dehydrogenase|nr:acyl-CoA dehydrogenase C-terminal domain-containing protein [Acetobacteraceae bacterium]
MSDYQPPLADMRFVLHELIGLERIAALPGCEQVDRDLVDAILDEAGKLARDVLAPLNKVGDTEGSRLLDGAVRTPSGFRDAYQQFIAGGWSALTGDPDHGGQGLPAVVSAAVQEMWNSANMGFALCPLLSVGAIEALSFAGTDVQKALYLGKLIDGTWTGTMNLTEPQAGSDLAAVRTRAVPEGDHYRLFGQKIFITYGEHDFTDNIIHLVLARLPDAPEGVKGISLFLAPKFLVNPDGSLGARNDLRCVSLEHKLGIHASPTAVMAYGDHDGAIGYLLGEANRGLEYMFIMMNQERFGVGLQGVAISERAYQQALDYARGRVQGTETGVRGGARVPILRHPDVRRMLLSMKAETEAMRALAYVAAAAMDVGHRHADATERAQAQAMADLLIPVVKGCCTETALGITSTGIQVHGGMGFIEETGAAQHARDARILTIYEGTTGIQANDLVGRKIARDGGAAARVAIAEMRRTVAALDGAELAPIRVALAEAVALLERAVAWVVDTSATDARAVAAGAVPFLKLFGVVAGGWQMGRAAHVAHTRLGAGDNNDLGFYRAKLATTRFYADHVLPQAHGLAHAAMFGASSVLASDDVLFAT